MVTASPSVFKHTDPMEEKQDWQFRHVDLEVRTCERLGDPDDQVAGSGELGLNGWYVKKKSSIVPYIHTRVLSFSAVSYVIMYCTMIQGPSYKHLDRRESWPTI